MPVGERAIQRVTWNHLFFARPAFAQHPVTVFLFWSRYSGCVSARQPTNLNSGSLNRILLQAAPGRDPLGSDPLGYDPLGYDLGVAR
jgi:hypothetical protein